MRVSLDELEAEVGDELEPFELDLGGDVVVTLPHPREMPFESLVNFDGNRPAQILRVLMGDETFDALIGAETSAGKKRVTLGMLETILSRYYTHYGLASPGEGGASLPSLNGSAGRSKRTSRGTSRASA